MPTSLVTGGPLNPVLKWEWRGGSVQKNADRNGKTYCVVQTSGGQWKWGEVDTPGFIPSALFGLFATWQIAAAHCEDHIRITEDANRAGGK